LEELKQNDITMKELHKDVPQEKTRPPSPMKGTEQAVLTTPQSGEQSKKMQMEDREHGSTSSIHMASCGTMTAQSEHEDDPTWVPTQVTHDFSYPSDEEIVPNPKTAFFNGLLPKVRRGFKRSDNREREDMSSAPCFPITSGSSKSEGELSPRAYNDLRSQLPQNPASLERVARRPGALTRLKGIATQKIEGTMTPVDRDFKDGESDGESSVSLEQHTSSPRYSELAHSIASDEESEDEVQNTVRRTWSRIKLKSKVILLIPMGRMIQAMLHSQIPKIKIRHFLRIHNMECPSTFGRGRVTREPMTGRLMRSCVFSSSK
jgi:hypothetical protein